MERHDSASEQLSPAARLRPAAFSETGVSWLASPSSAAQIFAAVTREKTSRRSDSEQARSVRRSLTVKQSWAANEASVLPMMVPLMQALASNHSRSGSHSASARQPVEKRVGACIKPRASERAQGCRRRRLTSELDLFASLTKPGRSIKKKERRRLVVTF
jgi:hypothetical protein